MESNKVSNCPFCGGDSIIVVEDTVTTSYHCECISCGNTTRLYLNESDAKRAWNKRHIEMLDNEEAIEPIQDALYATGRFTIDECDTLAEGILMYIKDRNICMVLIGQ